MLFVPMFGSCFSIPVRIVAGDHNLYTYDKTEQVRSKSSYRGYNQLVVIEVSIVYFCKFIAIIMYTETHGPWLYYVSCFKIHSPKKIKK